MKKLFIMICGTLITFSLSAQVETSQGTMLLGLGTDALSFTSLSVNDMDGGTVDYDLDKNTRSEYKVNTKVGYFVSDGFAIGLGVLLAGATTIQEEDSDDYKRDSTGYAISPFVRYHFGESGVYGEVAYSVGSSSLKIDNNGNDYESEPIKVSGLVITAGYAIYVDDMISINPSLSYSLLTSVIDDAAYDANTGGYDDLEIKMSGIGFALGVNLYLGN
jgi:hypothetical protein